MPPSSREAVERIRSRKQRQGGVSPKLVALGLLLAVGFASGFALSAEVSPPVHLPPQPPQPAKSGEGGEVQVTVPAAGRDKGGPAQAAAEPPEREGRSAGGGERQASRGSIKVKVGEGASKDGPDSADAGRRRSAGSARDAPPDPPCRTVDVLGAEAARLLSGNTADGFGGAGAGAELLYFSPRGWVGRVGASTIDVRAWSPEADSLCEPNPARGGAPSCAVLHARRCLEADSRAPRLGELLRPGGRWVPITRGRDRDVPGDLPFLDEPRPAAQDEAESVARARPRPPRDGESFTGGTAYRIAKGLGASETIVVYAKDGRRFTFPHPSTETLRRGLSVGIGWWDFAGGTLCQGEGARGVQPSCYRPRKGVDGRLTLVSTARLPRIDLLALDDPGPVVLGGE